MMAGGKPVDGFMGAQPEGQVRQFLDKHLPSEDFLQAQVAAEQLAPANLLALAAKESSKRTPAETKQLVDFRLAQHDEHRRATADVEAYKKHIAAITPRGIQTEVEYVEGMSFDRGYVSPYFVTNPERMEAVIDEPYIFVTDQKLTSVNDILPLLEKQLGTSKDLILIAEDIEGEALATLAVNKLRGTINVVAVKAPGFGDRRKENLSDIAALTGATLISPELGRALESAEPADLGRARRVVVSKEETTIIEGRGTKKQIEQQQAMIKAQLANATSDWDSQKLQERRNHQL